jgi:transposase InsO family protein
MDVLRLRDEQPAWGAVKIRRLLRDEGIQPKAASTIQAILTRHGRIDPVEGQKHKTWRRFEHEHANDLWQMDFKGHFPIRTGKRCHPLTVLDDHSRFVVCLRACANERHETVQESLTDVFRRYGLPLRMTMDNGAPWGNDAARRDTPLTVWLRRLGVRVSHSRPYHPQTQGKDERFHKTLKAELLRWKQFDEFGQIQPVFDHYRDVYNQRRPHQALGLDTPIQRYQPSGRRFPEYLPSIEYADTDIVRSVNEKGHLRFKGRSFLVGKAYAGYPVALRPTELDGVWDVFFCCDSIAELSLHSSL